MILGILQARTSSTRLPEKVLAGVLGQPMLSRQIERLQRAERLDALLVATSAERGDDAIEELCGAIGTDCFRGSLEDVLDRFYRAAASRAPTHVVRLTGDCPLADPAVVDRVIARHLDGGFDYTSNALERSFPDGLDVEVVRMPCLAEAWREARLPSEREHVTPFLYHRPERYALGSVRNERDLGALRWVVDEAPDLAFVRRVYEELYPADPGFGMEDVLALLERQPEIAALNTGVDPKVGWRRSLALDRQARGAAS